MCEEKKNILTVGMVAKEYGISPCTVRRLVKKGVIQRLRGADKPWLFNRKEIDKWMEG